MNLIERDEQQERVREVSLSPSRELDIKLKMYQEAYHQITGRSEKTSFKSSADLLIDFEELNQIHHKISQICDVHNIIARSERITVFHSKERKEQFTSFERFKIYNRGIASPTLTLVMEYNFSILPHGSKNPQQYKVIVRLNSRVALMKQIIEDAPSIMRARFFGFMYGSTAEISVEYADYVVARSFIEAAQEWVAGCKKSKANLKFIQKLQVISHLFPGVLSFANGLLLTFFFIKSSGYILSESPEVITVLKYGMLFFGSFMLTSKVASFLGMILEVFVDRYCPLSYLQLNKGDDRVIDDYNSEKTKNTIGFVFSCLLTIGLGVISSLIANVL